MPFLKCPVCGLETFRPITTLHVANGRLCDRCGAHLRTAKFVEMSIAERLAAKLADADRTS